MNKFKIPEITSWHIFIASHMIIVGCGIYGWLSK